MDCSPLIVLPSNLRQIQSSEHRPIGETGPNIDGAAPGGLHRFPPSFPPESRYILIKDSGGGIIPCIALVKTWRKISGYTTGYVTLAVLAL